MYRYDHLSEVIKHALKVDEGNLLEELENVSRKLKRYITPLYDKCFKDISEPSNELALAKLQLSLFKTDPPKQDKMNSVPILDFPDLQRTFNAFKQAGLGLPTEEILSLTLTMRKFISQTHMKGLRFWGKICGTKKNYYVVEVDNDTSNEVKQNAGLMSNDQRISSPPADAHEEELNALDLDPPPRPDWKPPTNLMAEEPGKGLNKKAYYVCNQIGEKWEKLPDVTPLQISVSRMIRSFLTGELEAERKTIYAPKSLGFPQQPQSPRITTISLMRMKKKLPKKTHFENHSSRMSIFDLTDSSLANWVHHTAYILPQGRTIWLNPKSKSQGENEGDASDDEEEDEGELEEPDEPEPETGPPLLTPLSEDAQVEGITPWTTRITSRLIPHYAYAVLSSNLWPGAHAVASGRFFENIYIGWGQKFIGSNFSPQCTPPVFIEFPSGPEVTEVEDPTPEEEAAWRAAQAEAAERLAGQHQDELEEEEEDEEGESEAVDDD
ncbi:hypothetical protein EG68_09150 [Paragonimus skrjabini miyazakii]|uniref:Uncharacterized protein n=1 Tax=Paragonimus skrjabini miyazakii TaxID=59628 RepID=A0A8S9YNT3_9TREM|nr:hypothetical protein EG68_09150 [Paragonimus skrjabini miyazakii]